VGKTNNFKRYVRVHFLPVIFKGAYIISKFNLTFINLLQKKHQIKISKLLNIKFASFASTWPPSAESDAKAGAGGGQAASHAFVTRANDADNWKW